MEHVTDSCRELESVNVSRRELLQVTMTDVLTDVMLRMYVLHLGRLYGIIAATYFNS